MDKKSEHKEKSIELRSEKVRNIVGQIPSLLIRQGILIIGLVLLMLLGISAFIPYKKTIPVKISIHTVPKIEMVSAEKDGIFLIDTIPEIVQAKQVIGHIQHKGKLMPTLSPISGKLTLNALNNDSVSSNQLLFAVIPEEIKNIYGECLINSSQKVQLKKRQKVELTDGLGQQVEGKISKIYPMPIGENLFKVRVELNERIITVNTLKGEVIVEKRSVLKSFLKKLVP